MFKKMTAEILDIGWFSHGGGYYVVTVRDPKTGNKIEFDKKHLTNYHDGDVIEFEYTEPSSFLGRIFDDIKVRNVTKVRCVVLERQLVKIPKIATSRGGDVRSIANVLSDKSAYDYYTSIKLRGTSEHIIKFIHKAIQNMQEFHYFNADEDGADIEIVYPHFVATFWIADKRGRPGKCDVMVTVYVEPVDATNAIIHVAAAEGIISWPRRTSLQQIEALALDVINLIVKSSP